MKRQAYVVKAGKVRRRRTIVRGSGNPYEDANRMLERPIQIVEALMDPRAEKPTKMLKAVRRLLVRLAKEWPPKRASARASKARQRR